MFQIRLKQKVISLIFIPTTFVTLIWNLVLVCIPYNRQSSLLKYAFWLLSPLLMVEIILTVCTLTLGFVGITRYIKCWQQSYTFFVFILLLFSVLSYTSIDSVRNSLDQIYAKIFSSEISDYKIYLYSVQTDFHCIEWSPGSETGCREQINSEIGDYPEFCQKYIMCSIILLSVYLAFNLFISLFVSLDDGDLNKIREDDE